MGFRQRRQVSTALLLLTFARSNISFFDTRTPSGKGAELLSRTTIGAEAGGVPPTNSTTDAEVVQKEADATPRRGWRRSQMSGCMIRPGKLQESLRAIEKISADIKAGKIDSVAPDEVVEVANINSSLQIVLSGTRVGVSLASDRLRQLNLGARAVNLPVSGPYHSSLMSQAAEFLMPAIDALPLRELDPVGEGRGYAGPLQLVSSSDGAPLLQTVPDIRRDLSGALARPVMWLQSIERMLEHGVQRFICLGPGRACAHLLSKELAHRDRMDAAQGKPPGSYEVWSINSVEDVSDLRVMRKGELAHISFPFDRLSKSVPYSVVSAPKKGLHAKSRISKTLLRCSNGSMSDVLPHCNVIRFQGSFGARLLHRTVNIGSCEACWTWH